MSPVSWTPGFVVWCMVSQPVRKTHILQRPVTEQRLQLLHGIHHVEHGVRHEAPAGAVCGEATGWPYVHVEGPSQALRYYPGAREEPSSDHAWHVNPRRCPAQGPKLHGSRPCRTCTQRSGSMRCCSCCCFKPGAERNCLEIFNTSGHSELAMAWYACWGSQCGVVSIGVFLALMALPPCWQPYCNC